MTRGADKPVGGSQAAEAGGAADPTALTAEAPSASAGGPDAAIQSEKSVWLDGVIHAWVYTHIAGGAVARNTEAWNGLQAALPALKQAILEGG